MLIEIDRICRKYEISYSLDGGTLLGAARHKGFIPWDEDADVIFLRGEYRRFRKICESELDTRRFFLQDYRSDPEYRWGYAKLRRNGTEYVRCGQEHLQQKSGVFLDILVVDAVPDNYFARRIHHFCCFLIRKGLYAAVGKYQAQNTFLRSVYVLLAHVPRDWWFTLRDELIRSAGNGRTELIAHYTLEYPKRCRYGLPRRCFDHMIEMEFEGKTFLCFEEYAEYLYAYYGDWEKLPPEVERRPHMSFSKISLTEPEF